MKMVKFTLKQHTPIVHFQAKDNGATLRASEVKSKLDRYIISKIGSGKVEQKGWHIPGQKSALHYKLSFHVEGSIKYFLPMNNVAEKFRNAFLVEANKKLSLPIEMLSPSPYFANEDKLKKPGSGDNKWDEVRLATQIEGDICGEILCQNEELSKMIESHLQSFFLLHNFGARQSKGFGSYTVRLLNDKPINEDKKSIAQKMCDLRVYNCLKSRVDVHHQLSQIQRFHHKLKTAANGQYSELRQYFHEKAIEWEKPLVREMVGLGKEKGTKSYITMYVRALLGLHGQFEFPQLNRRVKVSNQVANPPIERFASPIIYKPIGDIIYLILKDIPDKMFDMEFVLSTEMREERVRTPKKATFDIEDFMAYVQDKNIKNTEELL